MLSPRKLLMPCVLPLAASVFLVALIALGISAQTQTVELRLQLKRGETLAYAFMVSVQGAFTGDLQGSVDSMSQGYEVVRVLDVDRNESMLIEVTLEGVKNTARGRSTEPLSFHPMVFRVRNDGRVMEVVRGPLSPEEYPMELPEHPLAISESWTREELLHIGTALLNVKAVFTLVGIEQTGSGQVARIKFQGESHLEGRTPGLLPGTLVNLQGNGHGNGELQWLVDQGRLAHIQFDSAEENHMELSAGDRTMHVALALKMTGRSELVAPEVAKVDILQDLLILPGAGIGSFHLGQSVVDLTARLGKPILEPDVGFRSQRLRWPNGLVGHTAEADSTQLAALEVADLRYQTDKGIGLGSPERAVRFAYGESPTRIDITSVRLGANQFLVYDEHGVAFAFETDPWRTDRSRPSTRRGTVSFVIVFPPGNAAKIFPTP